MADLVDTIYPWALPLVLLAGVALAWYYVWRNKKKLQE